MVSATTMPRGTRIAAIRASSTTLKTIPTLQQNAIMSETTIQLREQNTEETEKMAQYKSPDGDDVCVSYIDRDAVADSIGEFAEVRISDGESNIRLGAVSDSGTGNFAVFETPGGAVTGFYLAHNVWADVIGEEVERDDDDVVTNAPESLRFEFAPSTEEAWEETQAVPEEEADSLLASDDSEDEEESDEEEVEISDEELDLVAEE